MKTNQDPIEDLEETLADLRASRKALDYSTPETLRYLAQIATAEVRAHESLQRIKGRSKELHPLLEGLTEPQLEALRKKLLGDLGKLRLMK